MAEQSERYWLVLQAKDSKYADIEGKAYEYARHIPNAQRIGVGDILVIALPKTNAPDGQRILGLGRVGAIQGQGTDCFIASRDRYLKLSKWASFEEIGGDPRKNHTNWINPIDLRSGTDSWNGKASRAWGCYP